MIKILNPIYTYIAVDLGTVDPTSDETERETKQTVNKLINNYENLVDQTPREPEELSNLSFPVMSTLNITDQSPGPFRQFSVLFGQVLELWIIVTSEHVHQTNVFV